MSKIKKSISINEDTAEMVLAYPVPLPFSSDFSSRISEIVNIATGMLKEARKEIRNYFSVEEASLITESSKSMLFSGTGSPREFLGNVVANDMLFKETHKKWNVEIDTVLDKINKLTEYQAYAVIASGWEYWNKVASANDMSLAVRRSFLIDDEE